VKVFLFSALTFLIGWLIHLTIWQVFLPKRQIRSLILIFAIVFFGLFVGAHALSNVLMLDFPAGPIELIHCSLLFFSAVLVYLISYTGIEDSSPTFRILLAVEAVGSNGISKAELLELVRADDLINEKIRGLYRDGHIATRDGKIVIQTKGRILLSIFSTYRKVLGLHQVGG